MVNRNPIGDFEIDGVLSKVNDNGILSVGNNGLDRDSEKRSAGSFEFDGSVEKRSEHGDRRRYCEEEFSGFCLLLLKYNGTHV